MSPKAGATGGPGWDEHRWLRYRRTMASLEAYLNRYEVGYGYAHGGDAPYQTLIARGETLPRDGYPWRKGGQQDFAERETTQLVDMARRWKAAEPSFRDCAPEPENPLRQVPKQ